MSAAPVEAKLGKNRTEAEVKRYSEERDCLEKEKEEIRSQLAQLRKEKRDLKEMMASCTGKRPVPPFISTWEEPVSASMVCCWCVS